ncbi:MAG: prolyl oligopeptidase family serine peptidase [Burkholderiales bacterium]|nr:prolyl oligopeptidase family serine peptidase [Burkholderiales bacterium]
MMALDASPALAWRFEPPPTPQRRVTETVHGVRLIDPYRWLEEAGDAQVVAWTRAQHEATLAWLDRHAPVPPGLAEELTRLIDRTVTSPPQVVKGREFFTRRAKGEAQAKLFVRHEGRERLLFDPLRLDPSGQSAITGWTTSRDVSVVAVGVQRAGDEIPTQYFIDTRTGQELYAPLPEVWSVSWTADNTVVYVQPRTRDQVARQQPLYTQRHRLGTALATSPIVLRLTDARQWGGVFEFEYAPYTVTVVGEGHTPRYAIARTGSQEPPRVIFDEKEANATLELIGETLYAWTTAGAPKGRIMTASMDRPEFSHWRELIPERPDAQIEGFAVTRRYLIVREKRELLGRLRVHGLDGAFLHELEPPEFGSVSSLAYDRDADRLYVGLSSFTAPYTLYRIDPVTWRWEKVYQDESVIDTGQIETRLVKYPSRDGTLIPMFVSYRKGTRLDGSNPTLLYGYGGFGVGIGVGYLGSWALLINRGVVLAQPGLRGGDEYGQSWHRAGQRANKQNVFDDFHAAAEWLVREGYTRRERLVAMGGSNGGLLVAAAVTQRPELYGAVICSVPLLDMVRYHRFRIARYWIPEYGDPDRPEEFAWLLRYSPYHNIRLGVELPPMLVIAGENDTRVDPLHARKFVARAQNNPGQQHPIMLKMDFGAGHGSGKSTAQQVEDRLTWMRFFFAAVSERGR